MVDLLYYLFWPLLNQRGQFKLPDGDGPDNDPEPGDPGSSGGEPGEPPEPEPEPEPTPEPGEPAPEPEPERVPKERFDQVYAQSKETERKLEQFRKLGEEGYYKLYPDEAPEGFFDKDPEPSVDSYGIKVEGAEGEYAIFNGMTFRQVYERNPDYAYQLSPRLYSELHNEMLFANREAENRKRTEAEQSQRAIEKEAENFVAGRSKAVFDKPINELEPDQRKQIEKSVDDLINWMIDTDRAHYKIEDAFKIMAEADTKSEAAKAIIASLTAGGSRQSISSNKSDGGAPGYGQFLNMTPDQLADHMETLDDADQIKLLKNAPKEFRKKFPKLPYYD